MSPFQLLFSKAVGDLSSSSQDPDQEPGTFQNQPAAGPEGLLSKVNESVDRLSVCIYIYSTCVKHTGTTQENKRL